MSFSPTCGASRVFLQVKWRIWPHSRHPGLLTGHQTGHLPFRSLPDLFPFCYANPSSPGNYTTRIKSIHVFTRWVRVECESSVSPHKSGKTALFPCKHLLAAVWIILILLFIFQFIVLCFIFGTVSFIRLLAGKISWIYFFM